MTLVDRRLDLHQLFRTELEHGVLKPAHLFHAATVKYDTVEQHQGKLVETGEAGKLKELPVQLRMGWGENNIRE